MFKERKPSTAWRDYGEFEKQEMNDITRINETMQGETAPRQSGIAKSSEINQALIVSAIYFDNFNQQFENLQNLKLSMIRYIYDEAMMRVDGYFEQGNVTKSTVVNQPVHDSNGDKIGVFNDVTSARYKWMVSPVDDSPSAKSRYMQDALMIINGSAGPLMQSDPTGKLLSSFWAALDNPILNEAGRRLANDMQIQQQNMSEQQKQKAIQEAQVEMTKAMADMERAKKAGMSLSFTGEQLAKYPSLLQLYTQIRQTEETNVGAQQQAQQQGQQQSTQPSPQGGQQPQPSAQAPGMQGSGVPNQAAPETALQPA